jgi:uncharacterized protein (DUF58 family)
MQNIILKKLLIKARQAVFSEVIGNNTTLLKGEGYDFVELREYEDGEDIKKIDWVISAKMQTPYVKVFHSQRELNITIAPILGGSVHFGTKRLKQEVISEISAILGYSCVKQGDSFNSFICNEQVTLNTKRTKKIFGVTSMVDQIYTYKVLNKKINYLNITNQLFKQVGKKSLIFLIGDFFNTSSLDLRVLSKKHEVVAIIVRDKFEEDPKVLGSVNLIDPQISINFNGDMNNALVDEYKRKIKENDHNLYEHFQKCGVKFTKIYTHEEPLTKLIPLMGKR